MKCSSNGLPFAAEPAPTHWLAELAIAQGTDPTAACAAGNEALKKAVNP